jgi:uncharacterized protein YydD (DUF2326 family)
MKKSQLRQIIQEEIQKIFENEEIKNLLPSEVQQAYDKMITFDEYMNTSKNRDSYPKFQIRSGHTDAVLEIKENFDNWVAKFKEKYKESPEFELEIKLGNKYFLKVNNPEFEKDRQRSIGAASDFYATQGSYKGD